MDKLQQRTYWDSFEAPYQMGAQKHRIYLLELLAHRGVKSILDVGCGTGPIYELIRDLNLPLEYLGVDYSPAMIEIAHNTLSETSFMVDDARNLNQADNSYDCVLLMHCLDHLDDYRAAIGEAVRVSKKYVCIVLWRPFVTEGTNLNDKNMMGKKEGEEPWQDTHLQEYSREVLEKEFENSGLTIEEIAEGEQLNSESSKYNFLWLLRKK